MTTALADAQPAFLVSIAKPLLFAITLIAWGWIAARFSRDAGYYYLKQLMWNGLHVTAAIVGFVLMLLIPVFWGGWILGMIVAAAPLVAYVFYREANVPEQAKWDFSLAKLTGRIDEYQRQRAQQSASLTLLKADEEQLPVPRGDDPNLPGHELLAQTLEFALPRGGDRIDVTVTPQQASVAVRIDGALYPQSQPDPQVAMRLIDYLKNAASLDVEDRRKKQQGTLRVETETFGKHMLEIETGGSTKGMKMNLWIDPAQLANIEMDDLGLLEAQKKTLEQLLQVKGKVVLIASPPQQGRTTTGYSLLQKHDPYTQGVLTLEDDQPFDAEGVSHNQFSPAASPQQIRDQLAGLLRGDPDVMLLSRIPDAETAKLVARSADEVRFYLPVIAEDSFAALQFWIKAVGSRRLAAQSLGAILAQRLVRTVCKTCRRPYTPDVAALKKLNLPTRVQQLYHASGKVMVKDKPEICPTCMGLGYRGRQGAFEVLPMDPQARAFIASGEVDKLRAHLRKQKVLWLQEAALAKVVAGETDVKEVTRALSAGVRSSKSAQRSAKKQNANPPRAENPSHGSGKQPNNKAETPS